MYKVLLTTHIIVSGGWLGVVVAKLALALAAVTSDTTAIADARFGALEIVNVAFPPLAVATIVTGVLLSLGTKWGLLQHYWVATKLVLTVGVIGSAVQLGDRLMQRTVAPSEHMTAGSPIVEFLSSPENLLIALVVAHVLMLATATVISVNKPWGRTWFARRKGVVRPARGGTTVASGQGGA